MSARLTSQEEQSLSFLYGAHEKLTGLVRQVAERQRGSLEWHRRSLDTTSGLPSQSTFTSPMLPVCVREARGSKIVDVDGNEFIDCHMGYTSGILGHNPPPVVEAVREALGRGCGAGHFFSAQAELGELVCAMIPGAERVTFLQSGSEAVAGSVRLARAATGKMRVAKFEGCYHGWTEVGLYNTMMILTGRTPSGALDRIEPEAATAGVSEAAGSEFVILPYNSPVAIERIRESASDLACVLVNPVPPFMSNWPDEAGEFAAQLRAVTSELGVPLVFDEVVTGFRLARGGAQEAFSVSADMACYGKVTSGLGIPLTMIAGKKRFVDYARTDGLFLDYQARKAWISTTTTANFISVVAALAQLQYLRRDYEHLMGRVDRNYAHLGGELEEFARTSGIPVSLQGHPRLQPLLTLGRPQYEEKTYRSLMSGTTFWQFRALLALTLCLRLEGVYAETFPTMSLSAAHTEEDVEHIARAIKKCLLKIRKDGLLAGI